MAKFIFNRLNKGVNRNIQDVKHWAKVKKYDDDAINNLPDGDKDQQDKGDNGPTSIPSPFARIALVKTAFKEVAQGGETTKIYEKIVSEVLDIAEIFFSYTSSKRNEVVDVITWERGNQIAELNDIPDGADDKMKALKKRHRYLSNTFDAFLTSDAKSPDEFNFSQFNSLFILKHRATGKILGATSPATVFFSAPDNEKMSDIELSNKHYAFDGVFHLSQRSNELINSLCVWCKNNSADTLFPELKDYIKKQVGDNYYNNAQSTGNYKDCTNVNVLNKLLYELDSNTIETLTSDDLLENSLITLPSIDSKYFVTGFYDGANVKNGSCLLPLKEEFFKYFTVEDLKRKDRFEIKKEGDTYDVYLYIPVKNKKITLKKRYKNDGTNETVGEGYVKSGKVENFAIFPNVQFLDDKDAFYRFILFKTENTQLTAKFFKQSKEVTTSVFNRGKDNEFPEYETYLIENYNFDRVQICCNDNSFKGIIVPLMPKKQSNTEFIFAVDFGTTNTHIEYCFGNNDCQKLDITDIDKQVVFAQADEAKSIVTDIDFIPETTAERNCDFPVRTALSVKKSETQTLYPFVNTNTIIPYGARQLPSYNDYFTDLKWDDNITNKQHLKAYIDNLCYLMRNKVVIKDGKLEATKIAWFYPLSMEGNRIEAMEKSWKLAYAKYFLGKNYDNISNFDTDTESIVSKNLKSMSESEAPYHYYKKNVISDNDLSNLLSIDIGGGTTDVLIIQGKQPVYSTSFRFAANAIFGNKKFGLTNVVEKWQSHFNDKVLSLPKAGKLSSFYQKINGRFTANSSDIGDLASFFFSIIDNDIDGANINDANYHALLQDDKRLKIVFYLFYTAIVYHIAKLMKAKNFDIPRHITFSGNGSKVINILTDNRKLEALAKIIFKKVYSLTDVALELKYESSKPKEITCQGGIKAVDWNENTTMQIPIGVLFDNKPVEIMIGDTTYRNANITVTNQSLKQEIIDFIKFSKDVLSENYAGSRTPQTFAVAIGIENNAIQAIDKVLQNGNDLDTWITSVLNGIISDSLIEQPLFFKPLVDILKKLSYEVEQANN